MNGVSFPGRRYFSNPEELFAQDSFGGALPHSVGIFPVIVGVNNENWLECKVTVAEGTALSRLLINLDTPRDEIYVRTRVWFNYPGTGSDHRFLGLVALYNAAGFVIAETRTAGQAGLVIESLVAGSSAQTWSGNHLAKQTAADVILRYKKSSGANDGILQTWVKVSGSWTQVVNQTNHNNTDAVDRWDCHCHPTLTVLETSGDKIARHRDVRWDSSLSAIQADAHIGVEFGTPASPSNTATTISLPLIYRLDRGFYGPDPTTVQFQRRLDGGSVSNVGSAQTLSVDTSGEEVVSVIDSGLSELEDGYEWRARVTGNNGFLIETDWSGTPLPSAAGGSPGLLNITFDSCLRQNSGLFTPHKINAVTLSKQPFIHIRNEDTFYGGATEGTWPQLTTAPNMWYGLRANMRWDTDGRKLYAGAGSHIGSGDQVFGGQPEGGYAGGDPENASLTAEWQKVANSYLVPRNLRPIAGSNGAYIVIARTLFIFPDCYTRAVSEVSMLGSTQKAAVKTLLETIRKPMVIFAGGAVATNSYIHSGSDSGWGRFEEWTDELGEILQHFATHNSSGRMIILSGNAHTCAVVRDDHWPAQVKLEIICSPGSNTMRDPDVAFDLSSSDTEFLFTETFSDTSIQRAGHLFIDETTTPVSGGYTLYDQDDDAIFDATF